MLQEIDGKYSNSSQVIMSNVLLLENGHIENIVFEE